MAFLDNEKKLALEKKIYSFPLAIGAWNDAMSYRGSLYSALSWRGEHKNAIPESKTAFSSRNEFFYVTSDVSGMSEGVFDTNKKINYIAWLETARRIY